MESDLIVGVADIKLGKAPQRIRTNLGSCIGVCLYSVKSRVGAMLHLMLPTAGIIKHNNAYFKSAKFADTGIPEMLRLLRMEFGQDKSEFIAKIFGGARVLKTTMLDIGHENEVEVRNLLKQLNIKIVAAKTGGNKGYKIDFDLSSGVVKCSVFGEKVEEY